MCLWYSIENLRLALNVIPESDKKSACFAELSLLTVALTTPPYTDAILILPAERRALYDHRGKPERRGAGLHLSVGILFSKSCQRPAVGESVGQFSAFITGEETLKVDQKYALC